MLAKGSCTTSGKCCDVPPTLPEAQFDIAMLAKALKMRMEAEKEGIITMTDPPSFELQKIAHFVLSRCPKNSAGITELKVKSKNGRALTKLYAFLPDAHRSKSDAYSVAVAVPALHRWYFGFVGAWSRREFMRSMLITALWLQLGRIYFVPNSSSKALSLIAAPRTVHDEEEHSSIAAHLSSVF
jgi:hypothetical protein